ncbi:MAG: nucleotide sugar dehydrogenase [Myxococcales bacterium]|nr:nucleotide sugar dehydrogenase [Myxococcales bacterium]
MADLISKIGAKQACLGVVGLGYVGLPLAVEFASAGFRVVGFDVSAAKVAGLARGDSHIQDVPKSVLSPLVADGRLRVTTDFDELKEVDCVSICVPTPLRKTKDPDISYIVQAAEAIRDRLHPGMLVVLESTTYPGTTDEVVLPLLEETGLKVGRDFHLAFSPERVDPGNAVYHTRTIPKVIGGVTPACTEAAAALYAHGVDRVISVSSTRTAEMVKLLENTFRAVNIGLVNETAIMCDKLGLDVWEVIDAAATKPFGFMPFYPGPGLGGHCIPIDPHYLSWKLRSLNYTARFIELADSVNSAMPDYVIRKSTDALNAHAKSVKGSRILVLGVAYKKNVSDARESPALDIIQMLIDRGADVVYNDDHAPVVRIGDRELKSTPVTDGELEKADLVLITTNHDYYDWPRIAARARLLVDSRNALRGIEAAAGKLWKV